MSYDSENLCIPLIKWLELKASDISKYKMCPSKILELSHNENFKTNSFLKKDYLDHTWKEGLNLSLKI